MRNDYRGAGQGSNQISEFQFTHIDPAAAELLALHSGDLDLSGLTSLSVVAAEALAKREGELVLHELTSLSEKSAEFLAPHGGALLGVDFA